MLSNRPGDRMPQSANVGPELRVQRQPNPSVVGPSGFDEAACHLAPIPNLDDVGGEEAF